MCGLFIVADRWKKRKSMRRRILPARSAAFLRRLFSNSTRPETCFTIGAEKWKGMSGRIPITASPSTTQGMFGLAGTGGVPHRALRPQARGALEELQQLSPDKRRRARLPTKLQWQAFRDISMTA